MEHVGHAVEQRRQIRVLDPRLDEAKALAPGVVGEVGLLDRPRIVVGEAVDADHLARRDRAALRTDATR